MNQRPATAIDLSIIVVTHNSADYIAACLDSVFAAEFPGTLEVVVVDNRSDDDTREIVQTRYPRVRIVVPAIRGGFARNANLGIGATTGRRFLLLNPDTELTTDNLRIMHEYLDRHDSVGAAGCRIINPDGSQETSFRCYPTLWTIFCESFMLDRLFPRSRLFARRTMLYTDPDCEQEAEWLSGAFILARRAVVAGDATHSPVGLLDERLFLFVEDTDWCRRIRQAGWRLAYVPRARALHHKGHGHGWDLWRYTLTCKGTAYYLRKHHGRGSVLLYEIMLVPGLILRTLLATASMLFPRAPRRERWQRIKGYLNLAVRVVSGGLERWQPVR